MANDWHTAYLMQAKSDYAMLNKLIADNAPLCHCLHYLQMTTEKLAKGFLTEANGKQYPKTHDVFVTFLRVAKANRNIRLACGFSKTSPFIAYVNSLLSLASEVKNLSTEGSEHPNPEYPWEIGGVIYSPTEYSFPTLDFQNPKMLKLLKFIDCCIAIA